MGINHQGLKKGNVVVLGGIEGKLQKKNGAAKSWMKD